MNLADSSVSFTIAGPSSGTLPAGITLLVSPLNLTLSPHASGMVTVLTQVDNSVAQIPTATPPAVTGSIRLFSTADTLTIPYALLLGSYIDLDITALPGPDFGTLVFFARRDGYSFNIYSPDAMHYNSSLGEYTVRQLLPPGLYEVIANIQLPVLTFGGTVWLVRDSVNVHPSASVSMNINEAIYSAGPLLEDEQGAPVDSTTLFYFDSRIYSNHSSCSFGYSMRGRYLNILQSLDKLPPLSSEYIYDYDYESDALLPKLYTYGGRVSPVSSDNIASVTLGSMKKRTVDYILHTQAKQIASVIYYEFTDLINAKVGIPPQYQTSFAPPYHQEWYTAGEPTDNFPYNQWLFNFQNYIVTQEHLPLIRIVLRISYSYTQSTSRQ
jgi:hypothetical protein